VTRRADRRQHFFNLVDGEQNSSRRQIPGDLEHRQNIRTLGEQYAGNLRSLAVLVAGLISILGVLALVAIIFRQ
jgi:hypothetical protein